MREERASPDTPLRPFRGRRLRSDSPEELDGGSVGRVESKGSRRCCGTFYFRRAGAAFRGCSTASSRFSMPDNSADMVRPRPLETVRTV